MDTASIVKLTGTPIGTAGSYNNAGNTIAKAFDGDPATFVDLPQATQYAVGLQLDTPAIVTSITYSPRPGYGSRMVGGIFQGANKADFSDAVTLATITALPAGSVTVSVTVATVFSFVRYLGPGSSHGNCTELFFAGILVVPTFITGLGTSAAAQATYNVGQAPAVAWCDARTLGVIRYSEANPDLGDEFAWDFGAPGQYLISDPRTKQSVDLSSGQHGPLAAYVYDKPGTYTIKLVITKPDGTTHSYSCSAVVAPDARKHYYFSGKGNDSNTGTDADHPWTAAKFTAVASQSNVYLTAIDAVTVTLKGTVELYKNIVFDGPFTVVCSGVGFAGWEGDTQDVLIRGMTATSIGTPATSGTYKYINSSTTWINLRGQGVAVVNCDAGTLSRAVYFADASIDGVLIQNLKQLDPTAITSQVIALFGGSRVIMLGNNLTSSMNEITLRAESPGSGFVYEYNYFAQDIALSRLAAKGALCIRQGTDNWIGHNVVANATFSVTSGGASGGSKYLTKNTRITGNVISSAKSAAVLSIEAGANGLTADDNTIDRASGSALQLAPDATGVWPMSDIVLRANSLTGVGGRLDVFGATTATVVPSGVAKPAAAGVAAPVTILASLVTDTPYTTPQNSTPLPAATSPVDVLAK